ncbi:hypothetical protein Tco_0865550 [Tanacetum coccineum]
MKKTFLQHINVEKLCVRIVESIDNDVPKMVVKTTDQILKDNLRQIVQEEIHKEKKNATSEISSMRKDDPQSQAADLDMWKVPKAKFEKPSTPSKYRRHKVFHKRDHDNHPGDDVPPKGVKGAKNQKTFRGSKSTKDTSSIKQLVKESQTASYVQQKQQDYDRWSKIPEFDEDEEIFE